MTRTWRQRLSELLADSLIFSSLSRADVQALVRVARKVELEAGEILWAWGEAGDGVLVVVDGGVNVQRTFDDDRTVVFRRLEPGEGLGFSTLADEPHSADVVAAEDAVVAVLPREALQDLLANRPGLALQIIGHLGHLVGLLSDEKVAWRAGSIEQRLCDWLGQNAKDGDEVRITHAQLARCVGAERANVSRALGRLAKAGVIEEGRRRGRIVVRSLKLCREGRTAR